MIVVDNCIISSLAKIEHLNLLRQFPDITTTPGVVEEAMRSEISEIISELSAAINNWILIRSPQSVEEVGELRLSHPALSYVDCELIYLCKENNGILFSDDTKLVNIAENEFNIEAFTLVEILLALKNRKILNRDAMKAILKGLEKKDRYGFSQDDISVLLD